MSTYKLDGSGARRPCKGIEHRLGAPGFEMCRKDTLLGIRGSLQSDGLCSEECCLQTHNSQNAWPVCNCCLLDAGRSEHRRPYRAVSCKKPSEPHAWGIRSSHCLAPRQDDGEEQAGLVVYMSRLARPRCQCCLCNVPSPHSTVRQSNPRAAVGFPPAAQVQCM